MIDYWKIKHFNFKKFGYCMIFRISGGDSNYKYFSVRLKDQSSFEDYYNFDINYKVIPNSPLYKSIEFDISAGNIKLFDGKIQAINNMLLDITTEIRNDPDNLESNLNDFTIEIAKHLALE